MFSENLRMRISASLRPVRRHGERQLRQLRTDYLDVGMIHYVDAEADLRENDS